MTASAIPTPTERPAFGLTPHTLGLLGVAVLAWAGVIAYARHMGNGPGTMGLAFGTFVGMWALMMTAMMLPAVAPVGSLYIRAMGSGPDRTKRLIVFVAGYLLVWAAAGIPAYIALRLIDDHVASSDTTLRVVAAVVLAAAGIYQLTPLKAICLRHCRSPLGQLLRYGNVKGRTRDLKVSVHHAGFCLGCCWALMALFVAFGVMNVWAMLGLAALVVSEKLWHHGEVVARLAGIVFVALALTVAVSPRIAHSVVPSMPDQMAPTSGM